MARTKTQDKPSMAPEQTAPASADQPTNSPPGGKAAIADPAADGTASTTPSPEPGMNAVQETGGAATGLPVRLAPAVTLTEDAATAAFSPGQPGQAGDKGHSSSETAGLDETTSSASVELNPAKVHVYPLRSFMDEGELRRRGGPSYLVPRLHAEDLERRNLVSRTPLEE